MIYHNGTYKKEWVTLIDKKDKSKLQSWNQLVNLYLEYRKANSGVQLDGFQKAVEGKADNTLFSLTVLKANEYFAYKRAKAVGEVDNIVEWDYRKLQESWERRRKRKRETKKGTEGNKLITEDSKMIELLNRHLF
jgi:hypothetical protein